MDCRPCQRINVQVGFFPEDTVTEDYALSMRLRAAGFRGRYLPVELAVRGLAAVLRYAVHKATCCIHACEAGALCHARTSSIAQSAYAWAACQYAVLLLLLLHLLCPVSSGGRGA